VSYEGTHLALRAEQADALGWLHADDNGDGAALRASVRELLTQPAGQFSTGRYWEAIRRCLSGGELRDDPAYRPLGDAVLGGTALFDRPGHVVRVVRLLPAEDAARPGRRPGPTAPISSAGPFGPRTIPSTRTRSARCRPMASTSSSMWRLPTETAC
jgi:hypothetical protein